VARFFARFLGEHHQGAGRGAGEAVVNLGVSEVIEGAFSAVTFRVNILITTATHFHKWPLPSRIERRHLIL
jgi:hypothetical protein